MDGRCQPLTSIDGFVLITVLTPYQPVNITAILSARYLAGEGNRALVSSLGSWRSTIELQRDELPIVDCRFASGNLLPGNPLLTNSSYPSYRPAKAGRCWSRRRPTRS